jgi:glycosyltransferase involved in cell wall biosynthesis
VTGSPPSGDPGTPFVTVAMSVCNNAETVGLAIRSVLAQTYPHFELLIVDDGSQDGTAVEIARFTDPRMRVISDGTTRGLARRLNQIAGWAKGSLIARMDGDDFSYPDRFARQVAFLAENPGIDVLGCSAIAFRPSGDVLGAFRVETAHEAICARPDIGFGMPHPTWMGRTAWFRRFPYNEAISRGQDQSKLLSAFRESRFANLTEPLLGYRQDVPKVSHLTQSRLPYLAALSRHAYDRGDWGLIARGAMQQLGRTAYGAAALAAGEGEGLISRRFRPATLQELERFRAVRVTLSP